jgi:hypothetical protein
VRPTERSPLPKSCRFVVVAVALCISMIIVAESSAAVSPREFGIESFSFEPTVEVPGAPGAPAVNVPYTATQAGSHPVALTATLKFDPEELEAFDGTVVSFPTRDPKDVVVSLPPGLLGNPLATPRCPLARVLTTFKEPCPPATQVGVVRLRLEGKSEEVAPIINVTPEAGQSAEFAIETGSKLSFVLTAHLVHTQAGYGFTVTSNNIPSVGVLEIETTFWGVPADHSHDAMRGAVCSNGGVVGKPVSDCVGGKEAGVEAVPFLTLPADCEAGVETATVRADSWQEPGNVEESKYSPQYKGASASLPPMTGCNVLAFNPTIEVQPETRVADEPTGLGIDLHVPLNEDPGSNATPQLRNSVVTLPQGLSVSPGVVDGVRACEEFGPEGIDITGPESEEKGLNGELQLAPGHCPAASRIGTAVAFTPLLPVPVEGHLFLAKPGCGGLEQRACTEQDALDGNLYRLYLELGGTGDLARTGVHFKVALSTGVNPATGQLTSTALGTPQAPFNDLKIRLNGGARAPLATPASCGAAVTTTDFTPWSAPGRTPEGLFMTGTPDATPSSFFNVVGCAAPTTLKPGLHAGTVNPRAARYSPFTLELTRGDREQFVKGVQVHTPPGLLGMLSNVPLCGEAAADDGRCPETSRIGTTRVASGAGSHPFEIGGNVYLTGPYRGAPFGLSIVTNAVAGPFNLGLVVVRARIQVDPHDSTLTITTDESGDHAIPQLLFGVPLRLKRIVVNVDRPSFMFNPTNCSAHRLTATVSGAEDAVAQATAPFAASGCDKLAFKPKFTVSTDGRTNRHKGASLDAKLSYPVGSLGNEANVASVKVSLPRQLPSRLGTLQQACPAATFETSPARCPKASIVGTVRASTPLLPVGLAGPVYFVSHGGEAFPSLIIVLQGDGVRVDLVGATFISKSGITSSTFRTVPDVPVNSFELYLPQGANSALAANGNLCKLQSKLLMPTAFTAQNGLQLKQRTKITVTHCGKSKAKSARRSRLARGRR